MCVGMYVCVSVQYIDTGRQNREHKRKPVVQKKIKSVKVRAPKN
jgi:hypothetical protein